MHIQRFTCLTRVSLFALLVFICASPAFGRGAASGYCQQGGQTVTVLGYQSSAATPVQGSYTGSGCNVLVLYSNGGGVTATGPSGLVSTSGTAVTWLAGNVFNANGQWTGLAITINSVTYTISTCASATSCTLMSSAGVQTVPVAYSMSAATPAAIFSDNASTGKSNPFTVSATGYWFYYADNGSYANQYSGTAIQTTYTNAALPLSDPSNLPNVIRWNATLGTTFAQQCTAAQSAPNTAIAVDSAVPVAIGFTASCHILFYPNGIIQPASGQTVTLTGTITAALQQIFDLSLGGTVNLNASTPALYPQWWGAKGDGATNDTSAIRAATTSACGAGGGTVVFPAPYVYIIVPPPLTTAPIIPICSNVTVTGPGVIKIADNAGSYYSIFQNSSGGVSNFTLSGITVDQNSANNPLVSSADLTTYPRIIFHSGSGGTNNVVRDCHFTNLRNEWAIFMKSTSSQMINNLLDNVGGGSVKVDSSELYTDAGAEDFAIQGNTVIAVSESANAAVSAIETHGVGIVSGNQSVNMESGINIAEDSTTVNGVKAEGNIITGAYECISIYSLSTLGASGYGFDGVDIGGNTCVIDQVAYAALTSASGQGIWVIPGSNLPLKNLKVHDNLTIFDLSASSGDPVTSSDFAEGFWNSTGTSGCATCEWSNETIINAPAMGFRFSESSTGSSSILFKNDTAINPGSTKNTLSSPFRAGFFIAATSGSTIGGLTIQGGSVQDNLSTCRFGYGAYLGTVNTSGLFVDGLHVSALDGTCSSLVKAVTPNTSLQIPFIRAILNVPSGAVQPVYVTQMGSSLYSQQENLTYTWNGRSFITNGLLQNPLHLVNLTSSNLSGCGTSPTMNQGNDYAGIFTPGSGATGCVLTFNQAWGYQPTCVYSLVSVISSPVVTEWAPLSTAITVAGSNLAGNAMEYMCATQQQ